MSKNQSTTDPAVKEFLVARSKEYLADVKQDFQDDRAAAYLKSIYKISLMAEDFRGVYCDGIRRLQISRGL